jgi:transcriptional regulator with XRE-family HTH domain
MDLREVFAINLRRSRHGKGLSQEELADAAEINRTYLSKLETAATYAGLGIIEKLAKVLGIAAYELLIPPGRKSKK